MINKIITAVLAVGVIVALWLGAQAPTQTVQTVQSKLGALNPDIISPYISFGGVQMYSARSNDLVQATTTVCALQSPASTSTLQFGSVQFSVASSTQASTITLAKATTAFATTTSLGKFVIAAGAQGTVIASTTPTLGDSVIFSPNTYFVVGMQGGGGTFSPTGTCSANWIQN